MQYNFIYIIVLIVFIFNIINENILRITLIITSISIISLFIYKNKTDIMNQIDNIGFDDKDNKDNKDDKDDKDNKDDKDDKDRLSTVLLGLKEYEKYYKDNDFFKGEDTINKSFIILNDGNSFLNAGKYYEKLNKMIEKLKGGEVKYTEYSIDSLMELLNKTCNSYQSISINIPPNDINNAFNTDDFSVDTKNQELHKLVNELHGLKSKEIYKVYDIYNKKEDINQYYKFLYRGPEPYIKREQDLY